MPKLGDLYFDILFKDKTDDQIKKIIGNIEKKTGVKLNLDVNKKVLQDDVSKALSQKDFKVRIVIDKAKASQAVQQALQKAGLDMNTSASDVRNARIAAIQQKSDQERLLMQERIKKSIIQTQKAEDVLTNSRNRSANAQRNQSRAIVEANNHLKSQNTLLQQAKTYTGMLFSVYGAVRFLNQIKEIRGEFELQLISLKAILQDEERAVRLFNQMKSLSVVSPFEFKELTTYAKQLTAFQIPYEELYDTTKRLADLSAGLGVDMSRIILAYGQVRSASFLRGQEVRQFTEAGIPLLSALADKFTELEGKVVSVGEVFEKISRREVPFSMVKDVMWDLTNEGGKFYNMQEKQAESVKAMYKNLTDAYNIMLNSIGESNDWALKGFAQGLMGIMENWERYLKVLTAVIAAYGTYKAAIMVVAIAQKGMAVAQMIKHYISLTKAITGATTANIALGASLHAIKANPLVLIASVVAALVGTFILLKKEVKSTADVLADADVAMQQFADATNKEENKISKLLKTYDELKGKTELNANEHSKLKSTISELANTVPDAISAFDEYGRAIDINKGKVEEYNENLIELSKESLKYSLKETEERIKQLKKENEARQKTLKKNTKSITRSTGPGTTGYVANIQLTDKERNKIIREYQKAANELADAENKAVDIRNILAGGFSGKNAPTDNLADWAKNLNAEIGKLNLSDGLKNMLKVSSSDVSFDDFRDNIIDSLEKLEMQFKNRNLAPSLIPEEDLEPLKEQIKAYKSVVALFGGVDTKDEKDPIAEKLKNEIDLIKTAYSEYEKLRKYMSREEAVEKIKSTPSFAGVDSSYLSEGGMSKAYEDYIKKLKGRGTKEAKELSKSLQLDLDKESFSTKSIEKFIKDSSSLMDRFISDTKGKWDDYKSYLSKGLDANVAISLAFGAEGGITSEVEELTAKLQDEMSKREIHVSLDMDEDSAKESFGEKNADLFKLWLEITTKIKEESKQIKDNIADALSKSMSLPEKIKASEAQRDLELQKVESQGFGKDSPEYLAVAKKWEETIAELNSKMFELDPVFKKLFVDTVEMSNGQLRKLKEETRSLIASIQNGEVVKNADGEISYRKFKRTDENGKEADFTIDESSYQKLLDSFPKLKKKTDDLTQSAINLWKTLKGDTKDAEGNISNAFDFENLMGDVSNLAQEAMNLSKAFEDMFDAMGNEEGAEIANTVSSVLGSVSNIGQAFAKGGIVGGIATAATEVVGWVGKVFKAHDRGLEKVIQNSQLRFKQLQNLYDTIEHQLERFLGHAGQGTTYKPPGLEADEKQIGELQRQIDSIKSRGNLSIFDIRNLQISSKELEKLQKRQQAYKEGGALGYQRQLMKEQLSELEKQRAAEEDKKKPDKSKLEDQKKQIEEMRQQILEFAEETANSLYGIDIKGWASELGDAIYDAWKKGEDGADAFRRKVGEIMGDVMNEVLKVGLLQPAMEEIRKMLFGEDGQSGLFGKDFTLDQNEVKQVAGALMGLSEKSEAYTKALDDVNAWLKENYGIDLQEDSKKEGLKAGIKGITEDTASLLASYVNAMRADLSAQRELVRRILEEYIPTHNLIAEAQLRQLEQIQVNTAKSATQAEQIMGFLNGCNNGTKSIKVS